MFIQAWGSSPKCALKKETKISQSPFPPRVESRRIFWCFEHDQMFRAFRLNRANNTSTSEPRTSNLEVCSCQSWESSVEIFKKHPKPSVCFCQHGYEFHQIYPLSGTSHSKQLHSLAADPERKGPSFLILESPTLVGFEKFFHASVVRNFLVWALSFYYTPHDFGMSCPLVL